MVRWWGAAGRGRHVVGDPGGVVVRVRKEVFHGATLYCGDCRDIVPEIGPIDAVVTDPPYGQRLKVNVHAGGTIRTFIDRRSGLVERIAGTAYPAIAGDDQPFDPAWLVAISGRAIIWGAHRFADRLPEGGWLVWDKVPTGKAGDLGPGQRRVHPAQKPIAVMEWCLSFLPGATTILDPYMGSGSTGVACLRTGRQFIGIEMVPAYFDAACRRIEASDRSPPLFDPLPPAEGPADARMADLFVEPDV